jgi:uncharacterized protein with HEPN domain
MNRDLFWLDYMQQRLERLTGIAAAGREAFSADPLAQDAALRNLQVISDSYERLTWERRESRVAQEFPWEALRGLRNTLVHESQNLDLDALWEVLECDLAGLAQELQALRA